MMSEVTISIKTMWCFLGLLNFPEYMTENSKLFHIFLPRNCKSPWGMLKYPDMLALVSRLRRFKMFTGRGLFDFHIYYLWYTQSCIV